MSESMPLPMSAPISAPVHGGRLHQAAQQFAIPIDYWIDLSTGINPHGYPLPAVPGSVWQSLPDDDDDLLSIAAAYYGSHHLLATAGSQVAIEHLPGLRPFSRVGILSPAYAEYAYQWKRQGHEVEALTVDEIEARLPYLDVVVVIRPNNPTAEFLSPSCLNRWLNVLQQRNGWLIVDEAFIDALPSNKAISMITPDPLSNLIVLRSVGKFFGLAGIRLGFVWAEPVLLECLRKKLGTWPVSSVARWAGVIALQDTEWQLQMRDMLCAEGQRLTALLTQYLSELLKPPLKSQGFVCLSTPLFCTVTLSERHKKWAANLYQQLARQGILIRYFEHSSAVRFGLPANEAAWQRLESSLLELER